MLTTYRVLSSVCPATQRINDRLPHPAAGRLHLDTLWWTAGAETSERGIYRRAFRARSSRLPSLPQLSRSYALPPPPASTRSLRMPTEEGLPPGDHRSSVPPNASMPCASLLLTPSLRGKRGFPAVFHAVTGARNGNDLRMMKQPVQQRRGQDLVSQEAAPVGEARVGGQQDGAMGVSSRHQRKEMVGLGRRQFAVADLVNHQHPGGRVATQRLSHQTRIRGALQRLSQLGERAKERGIPCD